MQYYKLDPCHYFTSPGLSWDAMLKMTDIKLELMTEIDMFQFIEKGTRGGISYIANRYGKANNKYMIYYVFGCKQHVTMSSNWRIQINLGKYTEDSKKGLILEVDLEYPTELHVLHNDYPLAAEKNNVKKDCYQIIVKP